MTKDLESQILRQIEYYFGDINLPRDKFMREKLKEDDGWITLDVLLTFKRLANLTTDPEKIVEAMEKSELVEVSEDKKKLRRNPELIIPELTDERKKELMGRTAYAKGFPRDENLTDIVTFLEDHGPIESCIKRQTKDHKFKGSCFIIFKTVEKCKEFLEKEDVKYKDTDLIRKWQADYFADKRKEYQERIKAKKEKKEQRKQEQNAKSAKVIEYPKGSVIHFGGIPEGKTLTREELKEKFNEHAEVAFINFSKGDLEGYIRFTAENAAHDVVKKIEGDEIEVSEIKLKLKVLEGEEEDEFLKKSSEAVLKIRQKQKQGKNNRKRKGNFNNDNSAKVQKKEK